MTKPDSSAATSSPTAGPHRVAVVGSGPSGCFTAQALRKRLPEVEITVFDGLPTPYGLIRHGIAADHQGAKAVHRQFDRLFNQPGVRFVGNTVVGRDVPTAVVLDAFDAVVMATGLTRDRELGVPTDPGTRVVGAGTLLRLLNSDPDCALRVAPGGIPALGDEIAIVGTGNVAVDVARLVTKSATELAASDIDDVARGALLPHPLTTVHILGRSDRESAKWDAAMIRELAAVRGVSLRIDGEPFDGPDSRDADSRVADPDVADGAHQGVVVDVHFNQTLESITLAEDGHTRVSTREHGDAAYPRHFSVDTVVAAVGFDDACPVAADRQVSESAHVFHVGGRRSGRLGNLAENRKLAGVIAQEVVDYLAATPGRIRAVDIDHHLPPEHVTFEGWKRIDEAETARAQPERCRTKFTTREDLLAAAARAAGDLHGTPEIQETHP